MDNTQKTYHRRYSISGSSLFHYILASACFGKALIPLRIFVIRWRHFSAKCGACNILWERATFCCRVSHPLITPQNAHNLALSPFRYSEYRFHKMLHAPHFAEKCRQRMMKIRSGIIPVPRRAWSAGAWRRPPLRRKNWIRDHGSLSTHPDRFDSPV